jgi:lysophospholipase L1-like esterase
MAGRSWRLVARTLARVRVPISGTTVLVVGILLGLVIGGPEVREGGGTGRSEAVVHTAAAPGPTRAPSPTNPPVAEQAAIVQPVAEQVAAPNPVPTFDPSLPVTVGLGDSITFKAHSWFRQLCAEEVAVQNCLNSGISGNTTAQMLARLNRDALVYGPEMVLVMGGTNDLKHEVSTKKIMRRLETIIARAEASGAVAVLSTIPPRNRYGPQVLSLNAAIRKYATRADVPLLDFYAVLGTKGGVFKRGLTRDGVHPNRRAANLMAELAEQRLPGLLHPIRDVAPPSGS